MTFLLEDTESYRSYVTLCQSDFVIDKTIRKDKRYLEKVLQKTQNINYRIPAKSKFLSHVDEKLIGKTILHLAVGYSHDPDQDGLCVFIEMLLDHNADVMIKDGRGLTALHTMITSDSVDPFACGCINRLFSAQMASDVYDNPCDGHGFSHFHIACIANNVTAVRFFLEHGVDVNQTVNMDSPRCAGFSALHFALNLCAVETVEILLESGADLLQKNAEGLTPVHHLLNQRIRFVNFRDYGQDFSTSERIMNIFLKDLRIYKLGACDEIGLTILHLACTLTNESLIEQLLMDHTVDVNQAVDVNSPICPGSTPLHLATMFNLDIAMILLKRGADPVIKNAKGQRALDIYLEKHSVEDIHSALSTQSAFRDIVMSDGKTKLLELVHSMQDLALIDRFVEDLQTREQKEMFVPLDSQLWPGYTPLHLAVTFAGRVTATYRDRQWQTQIKLDLSIIEKCLQWNPKAAVTQDACGSTPLHLAFSSRKPHVVELLLQHCGHENPVDEDNLSHLHIACALGCRALVDSLTKTSTGIDGKVGSNYTWSYYNRDSSHEYKSNLEIKRGYTPLHIAVVGKEYDIAKLLLERGADINITHDDGETPIHWLISEKSGSSNGPVKFLWTHPDLRDIGSNYLHVATKLENLETVEELLKQGADATKIVSTAMRYAICSPLNYFEKNTKILYLMLQYGADVLSDTSDESILKCILKSVGCTRILVRHLKGNKAEQNRIRESTGLTMLHLACCVLDLELVRSLINDNVDVNAQMPQDSSFWPGCTSLHVLMLVGKENDESDSLLTKKFRSIHALLLDNGANVAFWSNQYGTPMHASISHYYGARYGQEPVSPLNLTYVRAMLDKYANFNENPVDRNGVSLFHVACLVNGVRAAGKLLEYGVDVNIPVDYYINQTSENELAGQTPLHLCLTQQYSPRMVDLLLKYGANVDARDFLDNTPLHKAVNRNQRRKIYEKFVAAGADVNAENVFGCTPLEEALFSYKARARDLKFFFEHGHKRNYFNNITQAGYMPHVFERLNENRKHSLSVAIFDAPGFWEPDEMGRSPLHNVVSTHSVYSEITHKQYVMLIERLTERGCAIDFQNKSGQTALHYASLFSNVRAVSALLSAGADINITDDKGDTPYSCALSPHAPMYDPSPSSAYSYHYKPVIKLLANHVQQLQFFDLYVSETNAKIQRELIERGYAENMSLKKYLTIDMSIMLEPYNGCPEELKAIQTGSSSNTFADFLSDTGVVSAYPTMTLENREAIDKFFKGNRLSRLEKTFGEHTKFLNLQYKKALARKPLLEQAEISLLVLARFLLPELCIQIIMRFLRSEDLKSVIASANQCS